MSPLKDQSVPGASMSESFFFSNCVPHKYSHVSLADCEKQPQSFHEYARSWGKKPESVILLGLVGRGKTQFAFAMIREMFRRSPRALWPRFYTSPGIDSTLLEAVKSDGGDKYKIGEIGNEDLLFIDDFGRESKSDRIFRQYFELLNMRYTNMKPTIISTNLTLDEIGRTMGDAIASRFQEWQIIEFTGPDLREQRKLS
jgi:DNA replication protein DnaC